MIPTSAASQVKRRMSYRLIPGLVNGKPAYQGFDGQTLSEKFVVHADYGLWVFTDGLKDKNAGIYRQGKEFCPYAQAGWHYFDAKSWKKSSSIAIECENFAIVDELDTFDDTLTTTTKTTTIKLTKVTTTNITKTTTKPVTTKTTTIKSTKVTTTNITKT